jgi:WD40 repeat protein
MIREEKLDYTIYGADMAENSDFAIITKSEKYPSVVTVYKQNGMTYNYNFASGKVTSVSLSSNGKQLAVLLANTEGTEMRSELRLYNVGKENYQSAKISFSGIPYSVEFSANGNIFVVGSRGVNAFNTSLNLTGEYLSDSEIYLYSFAEDKIAIAYFSGNAGKTEVLILNRRGKSEKEYQLEERLVDFCLYEDELFLQKLDGFDRIDTFSNKTYSISMLATDYKMIPIDKDTIVVCNDSYAKFLELKK